MTDAPSVAPAPDVLALLVIGMHRSGTSALAGTLHRLGIPAAGGLMPPSATNPMGYYENSAVMAFHDRFLGALGSSWDDFAPVDATLLEGPDGRRWVGGLASLIETELLRGGRAFSVKDPRMCRLVPLWRAALSQLGITPRVVIPIRHPREVAASLAARNGMSEDTALRLWLAHIVAAEADTRDLVRTVTTFDSLLTDWRVATGRIAQQLGLSGRFDIAMAEEDVTAFLHTDLRHHDVQRAAAVPVMEADMERCWGAVRRLVDAPYDPDAISVLGDLAAARTPRLRAFVPLRKQPPSDPPGSSNRALRLVRRLFNRRGAGRSRTSA